MIAQHSMRSTSKATQVAGDLAFSARDGRGLFAVSETSVLVLYQGEGEPTGYQQIRHMPTTEKVPIAKSTK